MWRVGVIEGSAQSDGVNSTIMTSFAVIIGLFEQMNRTASTTTQNDRSRMEAHALKVWGVIVWKYQNGRETTRWIEAVRTNPLDMRMKLFQKKGRSAQCIDSFAWELSNRWVATHFADFHAGHFRESYGHLYAKWIIFFSKKNSCLSSFVNWNFAGSDWTKRTAGIVPQFLSSFAGSLEPQ